MQNNIKYETYFDVWGIKFCVQFFAEIDKIWIEFILRNYISEKKDIPIRIVIPGDKKSGYMRNHLNNRDVSNIMIETNKGYRQNWENKATPIPPFLLQPYYGRYVLVHGCGVCAENGRKTLIIGDSMTGKTYLSLSLIKKKYKLITDDLLIFDYANFCILPYSKPIGLREDSLQLDLRLKDFVMDNNNNKLVFTADSGKKTWLVHINDIYQDSLYEDKCCQIERVIFLNPSVSEIKKYDLGYAIAEIGKSIIESGVSRQQAIAFLIKYIKGITELWIAPVHQGEKIARFVMERDEYV